MADWYTSSTAWSSVSAWAATHAYSVGNIVRQLATPTVGNERVWRCSTAGTSLGSEPAWTLTKASTTTEAAGPVWTECTGNSAQQQVGSTSTWTAPHARIENMLSWMAAGDRGFVSSDHTQTKASQVTLTSPGQTCQFFSVNRTTGNIPPAAGDITSGAAVIQTGGSFNALALGGGGYWNGFTLTTGTGTDANGQLQIAPSASVRTVLENCALVIGSSGSGNLIALASGSSTSNPLLKNCTFQFGAISNYITSQGAYTTILGGSITGATIPTNLFGSTRDLGAVELRGFDMSAMTSGKSVKIGSQTATVFSLAVINCKLSATASIVSGDTRTGSDSLKVDVINCDSGATNYRNERHRYQGDMTTETTITRTGGATNGTQKVSRKVITTANASINNPFELPPIAKFNKLTGSSRTATIEFISSASLNNNDIWVELEYLGSSSTPISSVVSNTIATQLTSAAAQTSSSATWDSSPATPVTQKLSVSFTPQMAGLVIARVKIAKASTTLYVDPKLTIS